MKTSNVVKVTYKKEWQSKNGPMHSWHVTMDNGDAGEVNTKSADKGPWEVGEEASYTMEAKDYNGNTYYKITKITPFKQGAAQGGGSKWVPDAERESRKERWAKQLIISRQAALNTAASLISAGNGQSSVENLTGIAGQILKWTFEGINLNALANPPKAEVPKPEPPPAPKPAPAHIVGDDESSLPF